MNVFALRVGRSVITLRQSICKNHCPGIPVGLALADIIEKLHDSRTR
jgi:hypothetical protein